MVVTVFGPCPAMGTACKNLHLNWVGTSCSKCNQPVHNVAPCSLTHGDEFWICYKCVTKYGKPKPKIETIRVKATGESTTEDKYKEINLDNKPPIKIQDLKLKVYDAPTMDSNNSPPLLLMASSKKVEDSTAGDKHDDKGSADTKIADETTVNSKESTGDENGGSKVTATSNVSDDKTGDTTPKTSNKKARTDAAAAGKVDASDAEKADDDPDGLNDDASKLSDFDDHMNAHVDYAASLLAAMKQPKNNPTACPFTRSTLATAQVSATSSKSNEKLAPTAGKPAAKPAQATTKTDGGRPGQPRKNNNNPASAKATPNVPAPKPAPKPGPKPAPEPAPTPAPAKQPLKLSKRKGKWPKQYWIPFAKLFEDGIVYCGVICGYTSLGYWRVQYDDGDSEDLKSKEVEAGVHLRAAQVEKMKQEYRKKKAAGGADKPADTKESDESNPTSSDKRNEETIDDEQDAKPAAKATKQQARKKQASNQKASSTRSSSRNGKQGAAASKTNDATPQPNQTPATPSSTGKRKQDTVAETQSNKPRTKATNKQAPPARSASAKRRKQDEDAKSQTKATNKKGRQAASSAKPSSSNGRKRKPDDDLVDSDDENPRQNKRSRTNRSTKGASPTAAKASIALEEKKRKNYPERTVKGEMRPTSAKKMCDKTVKGKIKALEVPYRKLFAMSIPFGKSDDYKRDMPLTDEQKANVRKERNYPNVVHFGGCYTEMAPNPGGSVEYKMHPTPQMHLFVGSRFLCKVLKEVMEGERDADIFMHTNFESYRKAFMLPDEDEDEDDGDN